MNNKNDEMIREIRIAQGWQSTPAVKDLHVTALEQRQDFLRSGGIQLSGQIVCELCDG
jgi:hypothetical protein